MSRHLPRIAINGFGRIGRALTRIAAKDAQCPFELVAFNDLGELQALSYLLKYDSVHGQLDLPVAVDGSSIQVGGLRLRSFAMRDPSQLPWGDLQVDLVVEATGHFRKRSQAALHIAAGAKQGVISAPGDATDRPDATVVYGINEASIGEDAKVISAASCTTTCLAPVAKTLHEQFQIIAGNMTTVHAWTAAQGLVDGADAKDPRRGRSGAVNIVPTSTGAAKAIGLVVPEVADLLHGSAFRVPVQDVSLIDLVVKVKRRTSVDEINGVLSEAEQTYLPGVIRVERAPVVSSDLIGETSGSVIDAACTAVPGDDLIRVVAWYDNEWSYASRLYALMCAQAIRLGA
ncbi:MAG TPA: type I glyceraldehyde-3-phosphate dehydrogenase [Myxococcales bacterium]|nr:type I glyceraldehyde-3-phosphate dehydrogenase [Myxococcales bacterium]HAN32571.1 type I glyceraldehyde-3-phosphate dehydrogenase [Myxococcales bacterium]